MRRIVCFALVGVAAVAIVTPLAISEQPDDRSLHFVSERRAAEPTGLLVTQSRVGKIYDPEFGWIVPGYFVPPTAPGPTTES